MDIARRIDEVKERIALAAERSGREPRSVTLVAVSKGVEPDRVLDAMQAGQSDFGENRAQELVAKAQAIGSGPTWHFVGRLQTNKVRRILPVTSLLHSLDRIELAKEIERRAPPANAVARVLVEVNVSGEMTKAGVTPEQLHAFLRELSRLERVQVEGFMTMAPPAGHPEDSRAVFRRLRTLSEEVAAHFPQAHIRQLSMGMSQDYAVAVEEGATIVRVGQAIFGPRAEGGHLRRPRDYEGVVKDRRTGE